MFAFIIRRFRKIASIVGKFSEISIGRVIGIHLIERTLHRCGEIIVFRQHFSSTVSSYAISRYAVIVIVEHVSSSVAHARVALRGALKHVVMIRDTHLPIVLKVLRAAVAYRHLVVVMKSVIRCSKIVAAYSEVEKPVPVLTLIVVLTAEVAVIHPHMMRVTASDRVGRTIEYSDIAYDYI